MALKAGIIGLPNVGKSTLFNAITKKNILAANYPFATIDPNVGIVTVPDKRLETLNELYQPERLIPTQYEFIDIAGLVKGAATGEGLGNKFLANIREVDAIVQVVRCFENKDIIHVEGTINPKRDIEIVNYELILSDLEIVENRLNKIEKGKSVIDSIQTTEWFTLDELHKELLNRINFNKRDLKDFYESVDYIISAECLTKLNGKVPEKIDYSIKAKSGMVQRLLEEKNKYIEQEKEESSMQGKMQCHMKIKEINEKLERLE